MRWYSIVLLPLCLATSAQAEDIFVPDMGIGDDIFNIEPETQDESSTWASPVYSLAYHIGEGLHSNQTNRTRRFDARLQWEQLLANRYFIRFDGKAILHFGDDQQIEHDGHYDTDGRLREFFVQTSSPELGITIGQQMVIWGEMDALQVTDVMTPWDYSEFVFTAPEDARLGQPVVRAKWHTNVGKWEIVYNAWPQSNRYPGGNADELLSLLLGTNLYTLDDQQPEPFKDYELGIRWQQTFGRSDINIMAAQLLADNPQFVENGTDINGNANYFTQYPEYQLIGFSANYVRNNFLWKIESAHKHGLSFGAQADKPYNTNEVAIGFDYDANGAYSVTLETLYQYTQQYNSPANLRRENSQTVLRWNKSFLHETLRLTYFISYHWQYQDSVNSASAVYDITDQWRTELNITTFHAEDPASPGQLTDNWDQVVFKLSLSF